MRPDDCAASNASALAVRVGELRRTLQLAHSAIGSARNHAARSVRLDVQSQTHCAIRARKRPSDLPAPSRSRETATSSTIDAGFAMSAWSPVEAAIFNSALRSGSIRARAKCRSVPIKCRRTRLSRTAGHVRLSSGRTEFNDCGASRISRAASGPQNRRPGAWRYSETTNSPRPAGPPTPGCRRSAVCPNSARIDRAFSR